MTPQRTGRRAGRRLNALKAKVRQQVVDLVLAGHDIDPPLGADLRPIEQRRRFAAFFRRDAVKQHLYKFGLDHTDHRSEEHTSELQSLMRISYAVFCLKKKQKKIK